MNAVDVFCWIVIGGAIAIVLVMFIWSLCSMSRLSDVISEKQYNEYCKKENERMQEKAQKAYEKYRERYANDYGKTLEEATECQAVKNYKAYLEEQYKDYDVVICEKVGD